ncbi:MULTISPECIES: hypothetical protein [Klebsiella pneumoniae complex]|uniref:hypothetical protein n=1 Tax=Klebsiella pneumoniae complex TaxID=3390273 RepID=UPI001C8B987D|nr:hypothetical protein [Klebsiella variicola]MBX8861509.1 hypothetical protein [Klebsiella variicola]MBX8888029.1 hypothetical protein [Klebsiella variicola]HBX8773331.1 hypothetical protein [Klebsiella pneumoniae]HCK8771021.1 hypothetical protein [Klebsiella pneumoniae]
MNNMLFSFPEKDFFILLYNEFSLEFKIQKANAFLIDSCNCFIEGTNNGFRPLAFSNSDDELLEVKKHLIRARGPIPTYRPDE